jgi:hypothetical protein
MSRSDEEYIPVIFYEGEDKTPIDSLSVSVNGKNSNVSYSSQLYIKEGRFYTPIGTLMSLHNNSSKTDLITASGRVIDKFNNLANKIFIKIPQMKSSYVKDREDASWALRKGQAFRAYKRTTTPKIPGYDTNGDTEDEDLMLDYVRPDRAPRDRTNQPPFPPPDSGGRRRKSRKPRKSSNKKRKQRKTKRRRQ